MTAPLHGVERRLGVGDGVDSHLSALIHSRSRPLSEVVRSYCLLISFDPHPMDLTVRSLASNTHKGLLQPSTVIAEAGVWRMGLT